MSFKFQGLLSSLEMYLPQISSTGRSHLLHVLPRNPEVWGHLFANSKCLCVRNITSQHVCGTQPLKHALKSRYGSMSCALTSTRAMHPSQQTKPAKARTPTCHKTPDMFDKTKNLNQKSHLDLEHTATFNSQCRTRLGTKPPFWQSYPHSRVAH